MERKHALLQKLEAAHTYQMECKQKSLKIIRRFPPIQDLRNMVMW